MTRHNNNNDDESHDQHDLPPRCNASEWTDRELLERVTLFHHTPCDTIRQRFSQMIQNGTAHNLTSAQSGSNWAQALFTMCTMPYIDRSFYICMKQQGVNVPNDIVREFVRLSERYSDKKIDMADAANSRVSLAAEMCFEHHGNLWNRVQQRLSDIGSDRDRVNRAYKEFVDMVHQNREYDVRNEKTADGFKQKVETLRTTTCKPYADALLKFGGEAQEAEQEHENNRGHDGDDNDDENALNRSIAVINKAHCYGSNLCGKVLHECMNRGSSYVECKFSDHEYLRCLQHFHRLKDETNTEM